MFGAGNFGTCLADHLAFIEHQVTIYARSKHVSELINQEHRHPICFPKHKLTSSLKSCSTLSKEFVESFDVLLFAIPTQNLRKFLSQIKDWVHSKQTFLFVNKGLELGTLMLPSEIVTAVLGDSRGNKAVFLSGPSFAQEVVTRQLTAVCVASNDQSEALRIQRMFNAPFFRVYVSDDPIGVETAGAIKNVIAIGSGICEGLGMQMNARAALVTRGLSEITQIGVAKGGNPITFLGLSGMGDLMLTCSSSKSRNFTVGFRLGKGEKLEDIIQSIGSVAEGVKTTKAAFQLCKSLNVDCPIIQEMYLNLFEGKSIVQSIKDLMYRDPTVEMKFDKEK